MYIFLVVLHIILCILLVLIVLLQPGKGGDVGSAFGGGGGGGGGMFGPRGPATLLSRATTGVAVTFMVTSILLALPWDEGDGDVEGFLSQEEDPTGGGLDLLGDDDDEDKEGADAGAGE